MGKGAAGLQEEDYRRRSGRTGRQTRRARMRRMPAPARAQMAWAASPACADASHAGAGPGRASPGGTSPLGVTHHLKDYGRMDQGPPRWRRRTWLAGASARRVMIRRDRQWARTRMRPYTAQSKYAVCRGIRSSSNGSIRRGATVVAHHVPLQFHTVVYLRPVPVCSDLAALISQRPPIASQDGHQPVKRASSVRCINQR